MPTELRTADMIKHGSGRIIPSLTEHAVAGARSGRDALFRRHPQSRLPPEDPLRKTCVPYWDYNPAMRFELPLLPVPAPQQRPAPTDGDGTTTLRLIGYAALPAPVNATVDVWWLRQNGAGLFLPLRDGTAGDTSYAGGRYLLDTAKSADLGGTARTLLIDLNLLYHPILPVQQPMAVPARPTRNTIAAPVPAGGSWDRTVRISRPASGSLPLPPGARPASSATTVPARRTPR
jgi:hypothetical protein